MRISDIKRRLRAQAERDAAALSTDDALALAAKLIALKGEPQSRYLGHRLREAAKAIRARGGQ